MPRLIFIPLLALIALLPAAPSRAAPRGGSRVQISSHGIQLTLTVPRSTYPQDALVRVTVTLRNISHHRIWLEGGGPDSSGKSFPQVEVLDDAGVIVYPPALPQWLPLPGPPPIPQAVAPGHRFVEHPYVILRGGHLEATVPVLKSGRDFTITAQLTTPRLTVQLTASDAPRGHLTASSQGQISAAIERPVWAHGKLLYQDAAFCGDTSWAQHIDWTRGGDVLTAGCSSPQKWDVVAGWPNHSVTTFHYEVPSPTPPPVPGPATVTIQGLSPPSQPYVVHVGDTIELDVLGFGPTDYLASADPTHLELLEATSRGAEPEHFLWRWRAIAPSPTFIDVEQFPTQKVSRIPIDVLGSG